MVEMSKSPTPKLARRFENMLWVNSPKHWVLKTTYFQNTLFVSAIIEMPDNKNRKIRRSFQMVVLSKMSNDIWGLASDCIDEMKREAYDSDKRKS